MIVCVGCVCGWGGECGVGVGVGCKGAWVGVDVYTCGQACVL